LYTLSLHALTTLPYYYYYYYYYYLVKEWLKRWVFKRFLKTDI